MDWHCRVLALVALSALVAAAPPSAAFAQDGGGEAGGEQGEGAAPTAAEPPKLFEQVDRKHVMSMMLPKTWKALSGEEAQASALATFGGFFGEENKSHNGFIYFFTQSQFQRAALARAVILPQSGTVKPDAMREKAGWAEGCVVDHDSVVWRRYVEKNGRVYEFVVLAHVKAYDTVKATVQLMLDTAKVTADYTGPPLGDAFKQKKVGEYDVTSDAEASREGSIKKVCELLATGREIMTKSLPGKPFDASRPAAWIFQNATRFEDRAKAAGYSDPKFAVFNPPDRCSMVSILGENAQGNDEAIYATGAEQYMWQYFGGTPPLWVVIGMREYAKAIAVGGGKKLPTDLVNRTKSAIAAGKRRLDQWIDVASSSEIKDDNQGALELLGWHVYFRMGRGSKKLRKNYDAYLQSLRDTGDPAAARKAFDGVNFDEVLQDFKAWGNDWKP
jgi:hypothetical protein